ncbi:MAG: hypothetical protein NVS2B7_16360 [Herpetosiphon sp.]
MGTIIIRTLYTLQIWMVAQSTHTNSGDTMLYLHGDHLGSISVATDEGGRVLNGQEYTAGGEVRAGGIGSTSLNYTGQQQDATTGLLHLHARPYDPAWGRFASADSTVPGTASGSGGGTSALTIDFHEPGLVTQLVRQHAATARQGFWFPLSSQEQQKAESPMGPSNPQALNRYSYVLNNPLRYVDPTGHDAAVVEAVGEALGAVGIVLLKQKNYIRLGSKQVVLGVRSLIDEEDS